jgi:hypothetical protein
VEFDQSSQNGSLIYYLFSFQWEGVGQVLAAKRFELVPLPSSNKNIFSVFLECGATPDT